MNELFEACFECDVSCASGVHSTSSFCAKILTKNIVRSVMLWHYVLITWYTVFQMKNESSCTHDALLSWLKRNDLGSLIAGMHSYIMRRLHRHQVLRFTTAQYLILFLKSICVQLFEFQPAKETVDRLFLDDLTNGMHALTVSRCWVLANALSELYIPTSTSTLESPSRMVQYYSYCTDWNNYLFQSFVRAHCWTVF